MPGTSFNSWIKPLVISEGETVSRSCFSAYEYSDSVQLAIKSPDTLPETVVIEVSNDDVDYNTLEDATGDIVVPSAGKARAYTQMLPFKYFRLRAGAAVAADRTFELYKTWIG